MRLQNQCLPPPKRELPIGLTVKTLVSSVEDPVSDPGCEWHPTVGSSFVGEEVKEG